MGTARRPRRRALLRGVTVLPAFVHVLLLRVLAGLLLPVAWLSVVTFGRPPRWWRRFAWRVTRRGARTRAYAWLLTDVAPRRPAPSLVVHEPPATPFRRRTSVLWPLGVPWWLLLRYLTGVLAWLLATASWLCRISVARHPERLRAAQWTLQAFATDLDCRVLLLVPGRVRLPEPDPRLRVGAAPDALGDHAPLPPFTRRLGWIAIAVDLVGGLLVSSLFYGSGGDAEDIVVVIFVADVAIQVLGPYLGIYLASQTGPLSVAQFGLHVLRPLRSLGWAVTLIALYAVLLLALLLLVLPFAADDGGGIVPDGASTAWTIAFVGLGTVVAPMFEEFFYRGFMFQALRQGRGTWAAAGISSFAFAAAHFEFSPFALADRALIGIGLCWLFARTGRLLPGMFAHSINNAIVIPLVIGWDWQIAIVLPASLAVIALIAAVVSHRRGEWAPL